MQRPMRQAGGDVFGGRRLLARGGGIDSAGSMWGLVGQGRKPEAQQQRPVQPVRPPRSYAQRGKCGVTDVGGPWSSTGQAGGAGAQYSQGQPWVALRTGAHRRGVSSDQGPPGSRRAFGACIKVGFLSC